MKVLITGSGGLVGSACVRLFIKRGDTVIGVDNDMRREFFGPAGSTSEFIGKLCRTHATYRHFYFDIRDRQSMRSLMKSEKPRIIVHAAAQPSHDKAASIPYDDFDVNAGGTMNLLVAARDYCQDSPFIFVSTNKVYGDRPNTLPLKTLPTRFDYADREGIDETMSIDASLHSLFGASKLAADVMCQEFGRYFDMPVGIFRCGCITGPAHAAVALHGYLAYIVRCAVEDREYTIHGYGGRQVRDQIHCDDLARLFMAFADSPRCGEVYNAGGGRDNSLSIIETIGMLQERGLELDHVYDPEHRKGDHICYITDLRKVYSHFPQWRIQHDLPGMLDEMIAARSSSAGVLPNSVA